MAANDSRRCRGRQRLLFDVPTDWACLLLRDARQTGLAASSRTLTVSSPRRGNDAACV